MAAFVQQMAYSRTVFVQILYIYFSLLECDESIFLPSELMSMALVGTGAAKICEGHKPRIDKCVFIHAVSMGSVQRSDLFEGRELNSQFLPFSFFIIVLSEAGYGRGNVMRPCFFQ